MTTLGRRCPIQIGGAPTMYGTREAMLAHLQMSPSNPMYAVILGHLLALQTYRASDIRWTVLTPPNDIGQRFTVGY